MNLDEIQVLHVDDEPALTELAAEMLQREDRRFVVETVPSASEGLDRVAADEFDCIVSDYDMPGQNGIEFLETLREEYPDLPFILYTGKGSEEVASNALSAGATDYLQKRGGTDQYKLLANRIQNAVEQSRAQQRTAELERIRLLVRDINLALVRANFRSAVETRVCKIITESDPYLFAWIGEVDSDTDQIEPRAWAGIEEDYFDEITVTADETATGRGPGGTALRERRVTVSQDIANDPEFPWPEAALDRGFRAVAAIPLEYKDTLYGALGVYADCPHAFGEDEQEVLAELGADIGATIHSLGMQQDLKRSKNAVDHAGHAIFMTATDGTIEYVNPAFETVTGYSADEAVGRNPRLLKSGEMSDAYYEDLWETILDGTVWDEEGINRRKDGELYYARETVAPITNENDDIDAFIGIQADITERKDREKTLKRRTQAIDQAPVGISISDPDRADNPLIYVNDTFVETTGYPREEVNGENCRFLQGEHTDPATVAHIREAIDAEEPVSVDLRNYREDGTEFWNHLEIAPVTNTTGEITNWIGYQQDITERKQTEQKLVRQNERLEQFVSVVSHDLRNPLSIAEGQLELARGECDSEHLDAVANAHGRMDSFIDDLLTLAREGDHLTDVEAVDLAELSETG